MDKLKPIPNMANYTPRQLVGEVWEGDITRWALRTKRSYRQGEIELEKTKELLKAATNIILPAIEILPETYDEEVNKFLKLKTETEEWLQKQI